VRVHTPGEACLPAGAARAPGGVLPRRWCKKELVECLSAFHCACLEDLFLKGIMCGRQSPSSSPKPTAARSQGWSGPASTGAQDEPGLPGCFAQLLVRQGKYEFSIHAQQERLEEDLDMTEIEAALVQGEILEAYRHDSRGESCLVVGFADARKVHKVLE
jgi:Domain of unknown function (DUF4258)